MIALLLGNWRLVGLVSVLAGVLGYVAWANHEHHAAQTARAEVKVVQKAVKVQATVTREASKAAVTATHAQEKARVVIQRIAQAPGANDPIPDAVRELWFAGVSDEPASPPH